MVDLIISKPNYISSKILDQLWLIVLLSCTFTYLTLRFYNIDLSNLDLLHNIWTYKSEFVFGGEYNYFYGIDGKDYFHEQQLINTLIFKFFASFFYIPDQYSYVILAILNIAMNFVALWLNFRGVSERPIWNAILSFLIIYTLPFWDMHTCHLQLMTLWVPLLINRIILTDQFKSYFGIGSVFMLLLFVSAGPNYIGMLSYLIVIFSLCYLRLGVSKTLALSAIYCIPLTIFFSINFAYINLALNGNHRELWQFELYGVDFAQLIFNSYDSDILKSALPRKINNGNLILTGGIALFVIAVFYKKFYTAKWVASNRELYMGLFLIALSIGPYVGIIGYKLIYNPVGLTFFHVIPVLKSFRYLPFFFVAGYIFISIFLVRNFDFKSAPVRNGWLIKNIVLVASLVGIIYSIYISFPILISNSRGYPQEEITKIKSVVSRYENGLYLIPDTEASNQKYMLSAVNQKARLFNGSSGFFPLRAAIVRNIQQSPKVLCMFLGDSTTVFNYDTSAEYRCSNIENKKLPIELNMSNKYLYLLLKGSERLDASRYFGNPVFSDSAITFENNNFTINPLLVDGQRLESINGLGFRSAECAIANQVGVYATIVSDSLVQVEYDRNFGDSLYSIEFKCKYSKTKDRVKILSATAS